MVWENGKCVRGLKKKRRTDVFATRGHYMDMCKDAENTGEYDDDGTVEY